MNWPVSPNVLRAAVTALSAIPLLFVMNANAGGSIWWSGERNVVLGLGPGMNMTPFDLNGDGNDDFGFRNNEGTLSLVPVGGNRAAADPTWQPGHLNYRPLPPGTLIGAPLPGDFVWDGDENFLVSYMPVGGSGPWHGIQYGLLGVSFEINGQTHYGWIRMSDVSPVSFILHDWAYETQPGVPIKAGAKPVVVPTAAPEVVRSGYLRLKWPTEVGKAYQVQTKTHLDALRWTDLGFVIPATAAETMVDLPMEGAAQFFRVIEAD